MITINLKKEATANALRAAYDIADQERCSAGASDIVEIKLIFDKPDSKSTNSVIFVAQGPQLEVTAYKRNEQDSPHSFGSEKDIRYSDNDRLTIMKDSIDNILDRLTQPSVQGKFAYGEENRDCFLLAVFLGSEAVRNQLLSEAYIRQVRCGGAYLNWKDYLLIYRNWNTMSKCFYGLEYRRIMLCDIIENNIKKLESKSLRDTLTEISQDFPKV